MQQRKIRKVRTQKDDENNRIIQLNIEQIGKLQDDDIIISSMDFMESVVE